MQTEVPGFDVTADYIIGQRPCGIRDRNVHAPGAEVGNLDTGNAILQLRRRAICRHRWVDGQQQVLGIIGQHVAHKCQRVRVIVDAESGAYDGGVGGAIREADARREILLVYVITAIRGRTSETADQHLVGIEVVAFHPTAGPDAHREVIPAHAQ